MRYKGRRQSSNVEDRRGMSSGRKVGIGGGVWTHVIFFIFLFFGGGPSGGVKLVVKQQKYTQKTKQFQPHSAEQGVNTI